YLFVIVRIFYMNLHTLLISIYRLSMRKPDQIHAYENRQITWKTQSFFNTSYKCLFSVSVKGTNGSRTPPTDIPFHSRASFTGVGDGALKSPFMIGKIRLWISDA